MVIGSKPSTNLKTQQGLFYHKIKEKHGHHVNTFCGNNWNIEKVIVIHHWDIDYCIYIGNNFIGWNYLKYVEDFNPDDNHFCSKCQANINKIKKVT